MADYSCHYSISAPLCEIPRQQGRGAFHLKISAHLLRSPSSAFHLPCQTKIADRATAFFLQFLNKSAVCYRTKLVSFSCVWNGQNGKSRRFQKKKTHPHVRWMCWFRRRTTNERYEAVTRHNVRQSCRCLPFHSKQSHLAPSLRRHALTVFFFLLKRNYRIFLTWTCYSPQGNGSVKGRTFP